MVLFRFGVAGLDQGATVGGRQMHVDHLQGGEFFQHGARGAGTIILSVILLDWSAFSSADVITACVNRTNGDTSIISPPAACKKHEIPMQWNKQGPAGSRRYIAPAHFVGEQFGGGIVFYVYDGGRRGLIAARADQSEGI